MLSSFSALSKTICVYRFSCAFCLRLREQQCLLICRRPGRTRHNHSNPTALFGRVDFNISQNNSLNVQYTYSRLHGQNFNFDNNTTVVSSAAENNYGRISSSNGLKVALVSVINPNVVNELRGQIATDNRLEDPNSTAPQTTISDFGQLGGDTGRPRLSRPGVFSSRTI